MASETPEGLIEAPCPDCTIVNGDAMGCDVCEGTGRVLVRASASQAPESSPTSEGDASVQTERKTLRGGHDPREMALRRAALQRARKEREQRGELEPADQAGS